MVTYTGSNPQGAVFFSKLLVLLIEIKCVHWDTIGTIYFTSIDGVLKNLLIYFSASILAAAFCKTNSHVTGMIYERAKLMSNQCTR